MKALGEAGGCTAQQKLPNSRAAAEPRNGQLEEPRPWRSQVRVSILNATPPPESPSRGGHVQRANSFRVLQQTLGNRAVQCLAKQTPHSSPLQRARPESPREVRPFTFPEGHRQDHRSDESIPALSELSPSPTFKPAPAPVSAESAPIGENASAKNEIGEEVATQRRLIETDCARSEAQVTRTAALRRQQITSRFAAIRNEVSGFFRNASAGVQQAITQKQAEMAATAGRVAASVQKLIADAVAAAQARAEQIRESLTGFIQTATTSLQAKIRGVVDQILGLVNGIPLPDIPGVGAIRDAATGLLRQATGVVNSALGRVLGFVRQALSSAISVLTSVIGTVGRFASAAVSAVTSHLTRISAMVAQALSRGAGLVISGMGRVLTTALSPALNRLQSQVIGAIGKGEQHALTAIRKNRQQGIQALNAAVNPPAGGGDGGGKGGSGDGVADVRRIAQQAIANNRAVVQTFEQKTSGSIESLFQIVSGGVGRVVQGITTGIARALESAAALAGRVFAALQQAVQALMGLLQSVMQTVVTAVTGAFDWLRSAVQNPVDTLASAAEGIWTRLRNFVSTLVRDLLGGRGILSSIRAAISAFATSSGGPITKPRPGPITLPGLGVVLLAFLLVGALVVYYVPALAVVVTALMALGLSQVAALIVVGVAVVVLLLVALALLILLIRWLLKPSKPAPPPCTITTRTLIPAPDGSPDTRTTLGVKEQVELVASTAVKWSAKCGSIKPVLLDTAIWTAPDRPKSCLITATPPSGASPCTVTFSVLAPSHRSLVNPVAQSYTAGLAGSGFVAQVIIQPTSVCFAGIEVREGTVRASATGYYDSTVKWKGAVHPIGKWLPVDASNSGIQDTVGTVPPGTGPPFSAGKFHWPIPQHFRALKAFFAKTYSTGDHVQQMSGPTGEETTTKEGAVGGPRTP